MISIIIDTATGYYSSPKEEYQIQQEGVGELQRHFLEKIIQVKREGEGHRKGFQAEGLYWGP